jgi:methyl-accepting chemotaxis protein
MNWYSIKVPLMSSVLVVILLTAVVLTGFTYSMMHDYSLSAARQQLGKDSAALSGIIEMWAENNKQVVTSMADAQNEQANKISSLEYLSKAGGFFATYLGEGNGAFYIYPDREMPEGYDPTQRPWYGLAKDKDDIAITSPYVSSSTGRRMITFAQRVMDGEVLSGVVGADILMDTIVKSVVDERFNTGGFSVLVTAAGIIQVHATDGLLGKSLSEWSPSFTHSVMDKLLVKNEYIDLAVAGNDYLMSARQVQGTQWYVINAVEKAVIFKGLNDMVEKAIWVTVIIAGLMMILSAVFISRLMKPLHELVSAIEEISRGDADLTRRIKAEGKDEISRMGIGFNDFIQLIQKILRDVRDTSHDLNSAASEAKAEAEFNCVKVQDQQNEVNQVSIAIHQISMSADEVAKKAKQVAADSLDSTTRVQAGNKLAEKNQKEMSELVDKIRQAAEVIGKLDKQSQEVNVIVSTIQNISSQTNLLALNAAIEAARAGDKGRGFAVVADEVRSLSKRTHEATEEIQKMIDALQSQSKKAVAIMEDGGSLADGTMSNVALINEHLQSISGSIENISTMSERIAEVSYEQNKSTAEIDALAVNVHNASDELAVTGKAALDRGDHLNTLGLRICSDLEKFSL